MKTLLLAVVCPVSGLPQNTEQVRQMVWAEVTGLLQPDLGKFYTSFYPAPRTWGVELNEPFGVLLGRDDPVRFLHILTMATEAQDNATAFHMGSLLTGIDVSQTQTVGDTLICPVHLDGTNKELEAHSLWLLGIAGGKLLPDCGIYYIQQRRAVAGPDMAKAIAGNLAGYAVCTVRLEVPV